MYMQILCSVLANHFSKWLCQVTPPPPPPPRKKMSVCFLVSTITVTLLLKIPIIDKPIKDDMVLLVFALS